MQPFAAQRVPDLRADVGVCDSDVHHRALRHLLSRLGLHDRAPNRPIGPDGAPRKPPPPTAPSDRPQEFLAATEPQAWSSTHFLAAASAAGTEAASLPPPCAMSGRPP